MKKVGFLLVFTCLVFSCRKETEKECNCYERDFDRYLTIKKDKNTGQEKIIDSTEWKRANSGNKFYGNKCKADGAIIKGGYALKKDNPDGTLIYLQEKTEVVCE